MRDERGQLEAGESNWEGQVDGVGWGRGSRARGVGAGEGSKEPEWGGGGGGAGGMWDQSGDGGTQGQMGVAGGQLGGPHLVTHLPIWYTNPLSCIPSPIWYPIYPIWKISIPYLVSHLSYLVSYPPIWYPIPLSSDQSGSPHSSLSKIC